MDAIVGTEQLVNVPGGQRDPFETCREHGADRVDAFGRIHIPGKCREITPEAVRFEEIENPVGVVAIESCTECRDPCLDGRIVCSSVHRHFQLVRCFARAIVTPNMIGHSGRSISA